MITKNKFNNHQGVIMIMVLSVILIVVILANIMMVFVTSQSRLTRHQVARIQAYYAAQAGMIYTMEMIRTATPGWIPDPPGGVNIIRTICPQAAGCDVNSSGLPFTVTVTIMPYDTDPDGAGPNLALPGSAPISVFVDYAP